MTVTQEMLVTQIQDFQRQTREAKANYDRIEAECAGGIKTCTWMLDALMTAAKADVEKAEAEKKAAADNAPDTEHQGQDLQRPETGLIGSAAISHEKAEIDKLQDKPLLMPRAPGKRKKVESVKH